MSSSGIPGAFSMPIRCTIGIMRRTLPSSAAGSSRWDRSAGRFAEFDYINSDECIHRAMKLAEKLNAHTGRLARLIRGNALTETQTSPRLSVIMAVVQRGGFHRGGRPRRGKQHVFALVPDAELLVIDSSKDKSREILARLAAEDSRIVVIEQPPCGHGPALRAGMDRARASSCS